jgi:hypothetical protein
MLERWRRPLNVLAIEDSDEAHLTPDGRIQRGVKVTYDAESTQRIRLGYACGKCMEPFEVPWPETCHVCGAPVRARQREFFEREFGGIAPIGPRSTLDAERERMREENKQ